MNKQSVVIALVATISLMLGLAGGHYIKWQELPINPFPKKNESGITREMIEASKKPTPELCHEEPMLARASFHIYLTFPGSRIVRSEVAISNPEECYFRVVSMVQLEDLTYIIATNHGYYINMNGSFDNINEVEIVKP